jgi:hypothetical protein
MKVEGTQKSIVFSKHADLKLNFPSFHWSIGTPRKVIYGPATLRLSRSAYYELLPCVSRVDHWLALKGRLWVCCLECCQSFTSSVAVTSDFGFNGTPTHSDVALNSLQDL